MGAAVPTTAVSKNIPRFNQVLGDCKLIGFGRDLQYRRASTCCWVSHIHFHQVPGTQRPTTGPCVPQRAMESSRGFCQLPVHCGAHQTIAGKRCFTEIAPTAQRAGNGSTQEIGRHVKDFDIGPS